MVATMCSIPKLNRRIERYHKIKFSRFGCIEYGWGWLRVCLYSASASTFSVSCVSAVFFFFFSRTCWLFVSEQCICALFMDPQITLFSNFFIKNGSHDTIHTFKNYFATVFSVFNFQFQQNKFYPNTPYVWLIEINSDWSTIKINWIIYVIGYWILSKLSLAA